MSFAVPEMEKRFQVDMYREDGRLSSCSTPRSRWVAQAVASVAITQGDADPLPRQIVIFGQKGDRTEITLAQAVVNPPVAEDAFTLRLGPEVRVVEVRRTGQERRAVTVRPPPPSGRSSFRCADSTWNLTNRCNFACEFCPDDAWVGLAARCPLPGGASSAQAGRDRVARQAHFHVMGEPLLYPDVDRRGPPCPRHGHGGVGDHEREPADPGRC